MVTKSTAKPSAALSSRGFFGSNSRSTSPALASGTRLHNHPHAMLVPARIRNGTPRIVIRFRLKMVTSPASRRYIIPEETRGTPENRCGRFSRLARLASTTVVRVEEKSPPSNAESITPQIHHTGGDQGDSRKQVRPILPYDV